MTEGVIVSEKQNKNVPDWMKEFGYVEEDASSPVEVQTESANQETEFAKLFGNTPDQSSYKEGDVVDGKVVSISDDFVTVDIGYKSEGVIDISEFKTYDGKLTVKAGDTVNVYIEKTENDAGQMVLSKDKAEIMKAWDRISQACEADEEVDGLVIGKVKGGLSVDIGVKAFLPGSQVDLRPVRNLEKYIGQKFKFKVIKFNKKRGNIVLSRRAILQKERESLRSETLSNIEENQVVQGIVKNITDYGAFIDLGGIDGLLHITDMSWGRVKHPSELFEVGDSIDVKILKYDKEKERVSLGLKQVQPNPWDSVHEKYYVGQKVKGKVGSIKEYGAFIELEDGIEGLIHVSEMSWTQRVKHPNKILEVGDEVEAVVLEIDPKNKRISLGLKQLEVNPWVVIQEKHPVGTRVKGTVKNIMDFGYFVDIGEGIDGLVHISDMSWTERINNPAEKVQKGDEVEAIVLSIDPESEKFSLGVKQLEKDPWSDIHNRYPENSKVKGKVTKLADFGAFVELEQGVEGLIHISEISEERIEKASDVLNVGDEVDAEVISIDAKERKIGLSIKALSRSEERRNMETYMNPNSSKTTMGDALGEKLKGMKETNTESSDS